LKELAVPVFTKHEVHVDAAGRLPLRRAPAANALAIGFGWVEGNFAHTANLACKPLPGCGRTFAAH